LDGEGGKQIPFGNDSKKGKGNSNCKDRSRFPSGMTAREAKARAKAKQILFRK